MVACILATAACATRAGTAADDARADRLLREGKYEEALRAYSASAYSGNSRVSYRSLIGIALCYAWLGDPARFEAHALEASSAAPTEPAAHRRLGRMYISGAERFRATPSGKRYARIGVEYLRRVFFTRSDTPNVAHNLGLGLYLLEDLGSAAAVLEEAHRQSPSRDDTLLLLLTVLRDIGDHDRVRALLGARTGGGELPESMRPFEEWARIRDKARRVESRTDAPENSTP